MSDASSTDRAGPVEADGIETGKRLIRVDATGGRSLAERLSERLHLLAWRTPFHGLRLGGRYPLKLLTVADDPFAGDAARGRALLEGTLAYRGERHPVATIDMRGLGWSRGFADHVHGFGWLRDLSTVAARVDAAPVAEELTRKWLAAHAGAVHDPAWRPDLWGRRILMWVAHAPLILSSGDLVYRSSLLNTLARGSRHLERTADRAPAGPARIAAWSGVVAAGLMLPGGDVRRAFGEGGLKRALASSFGGDGGIVHRSGAAQLDALMLLVQLAAAYEARRIAVPALVSDAVARAVPPLLGITHGDRGLGSWQGGGPVEGDVLDAAIAASGVRTRPLKQSADWGYQRMAALATLVVLDAAPPPIGRAVAAGCASTLAFELSDGPNRIVVNCGGAAAANATLPASLAAALRTTAAHSTLTLDDANSTALLPDGTLGKGVREVELTRGESDTVSRIEASHDGYVRRMGMLHRRTLALGADGRDLRGEDSLVPAAARGRAATGERGFAIRFHLAPSVEVAATADAQGAVLRLPGNILWQFRCKGAGLALEDSIWIDGDGRPHPSEQIVVSGQAAAGGTSVSWWFHRSR